MSDNNLRTTTDALSYSIRDACRVTGLGRSTIYTLIKERRIRIIKVGRRTLVSAESLRQFLAG